MATDTSDLRLHKLKTRPDRLSTGLLVVSAPKIGDEDCYLQQCRAWISFEESVVLDPNTLGPTVDDIRTIVNLVRDRTGTVRSIIGCGGARIMAGTILGSAIATRRNLHSDMLAWLRNSQGTRNLASDLDIHDSVAIDLEVHLVPTTLLAVQSVPSMTWIVNDPRERTTYWASDNSLRADGVHLYSDVLFPRFRMGGAGFLSNVAIVTAVLIETIAYPTLRKHNWRSSAQSALENLIQLSSRSAFENPDDVVLEELVRLAQISRHCENAVGPAMPGLALTQAVSRITAGTGKPIAGALLAAGAVKETVRCLESRYSKPAGSSPPRQADLPEGWADLCESLHTTLRRTFDLDGSRFAEIARAATSQILSQKSAKASKQDYIEILKRL